MGAETKYSHLQSNRAFNNINRSCFWFYVGQCKCCILILRPDSPDICPAMREIRAIVRLSWINHCVLKCPRATVPTTKGYRIGRVVVRRSYFPKCLFRGFVYLENVTIREIFLFFFFRTRKSVLGTGPLR
jgi:hypothetical protein